ncbi:MAG: tripartite tricarboxylate transporter substrate binding protein, partial [Rubrivivax sp.]|nr:tripartite tricarboxylate transporter substrate binding protein [Rubrivivax sp.]
MALPLRRRDFIAGATLGLISAPTWAQADAPWPSKPIQLVVAAPPGGPSDNFGRQLADELVKLLGQPIVIDNRPGAGGQLAAEYVARAAPDGHVLMMSFAGNATAQTLIPRAGLDFTRDFTHVTQMMSGA